MVDIDALLIRTPKRFQSAIGIAKTQQDTSLALAVWSRWHTSVQRLLPYGAHSIIVGDDTLLQSVDTALESWAEEFWVRSPFSSFVEATFSDGNVHRSVVSDAGWAYKDGSRIWRGTWPREESKRTF